MGTQVLKRKRKLSSQVADENRLQEGRERIASAAAELFLSGGYHNTSVREIAQKAGVSVGSVFNYFTSKEGILFFLLSQSQSHSEMALQQDREEFLRLKEEGTDPRELFLLMYERYVRIVHEGRRFAVLGHQELKSLNAAQRRNILEGEERIQSFLEEVISYGVDKGVFPPGDIDVKAHCLCVLGQSWAVRHWALKRFAAVDDYLAVLGSIAIGLLERRTVTVDQDKAEELIERGFLQHS